MSQLFWIKMDTDSFKLGDYLNLILKDKKVDKNLFISLVNLLILSNKL